MDDQYDVFLCHNSDDKQVVRELAELLHARRIRVWLDEWALTPSDRWQEAIEKVIEEGHVRTAAVLVGPNGIGPWHNMEMRAFLDKSVRGGLPVIPVLLPETPHEIKLPLFLQSFTWVDLRQGISEENIDRLVRGITEAKPGVAMSGPSLREQVGWAAAQMRVDDVVPSNLYEKIAARLGVTQAALGNFFEIMEQQLVPLEKLDLTLREIAGRYKDLQAKMAQTEFDDTAVIAFKEQAKQALDQGDFDEAERLLNQARDLALNAAKKALEMVKKHQEIADKQFLSAATSEAGAGDLKMTQLAYAAAADYYGRAVELVPAGSELVKADYLNQQGSALYYAGKYAEAEMPLRSALDIRERLLEPEDPDTAQSLNDLALLYHAQGKYDQAEPLFLQALKIREGVLGPDHPDTATTLNNFARLYKAQGKYNQAEPLFLEALKIRERVLGMDHPDTAKTLNNLAGVYRAQGRYAQAEELYQRSLMIKEEALGTYHPSLATTLNNLAGVYRDQRRYDQAEPLYLRALMIKEETLGTSHPSLATTLNNLAGLYRAQGRYDQAEPIYQRSLKIKEEALGMSHPSQATTLSNLALLYKVQGKYDQAESLYRRALKVKEEALGMGHPSLAATLNNLALLNKAQRKYDQAEPLFQRALQIREKVLGPGHPKTIAVRKNLDNVQELLTKTQKMK
ncbi:MAG: toll/interleukin-1 receptor domain-containing protein [Deltaproteobacteria bacterium]|nr:toll/interleukin-1 receptor domain-containing protein [Deltaproteobacteria bacterium]